MNWPARRLAAPLGHVPALPRELLDTLVVRIGHVHVIGRVNGDAVRPGELPVGGALGAPVAQPLAAGAELGHAVVREVGDVDVAVRVGVGIARLVQLAVALAHRRRDLGHELAGGRPLGDRVGVIVGGQDHRAAVPIGAGADADHRLELVRPGRDPGAGLGVQHLHPVVACVGNIEAAVVIGDVSGVVEASGLLGPARPHTPPARAVGAVGGDLVVAGIGDVDGALVRIDAGRIHGGVRRAADRLQVGGSRRWRDRRRHRQRRCREQTERHREERCDAALYPRRMPQVLPPLRKYRGCAHPADLRMYMPLIPISSPIGPMTRHEHAPSRPCPPRRDSADFTGCTAPAPPVTARRCARPP